MRQTFRYTYRSEGGIDVTQVIEIPQNKTKKQLIEQTLLDMAESVTPIVEIDGQPINISSFLSEEIASCEEDIRHSTLMLARLQREKNRREKEMRSYLRRKKNS